MAMANALVLRIKFPLTYPLIHKVVRLDGNLTVKEAVQFIGESLRIPWHGDIGLYLPDDRKWLEDDERIGSYEDLQEQEFIEFKEKPEKCSCQIL